MWTGEVSCFDHFFPYVLSILFVPRQFAYQINKHRTDLQTQCKKTIPKMDISNIDSINIILYKTVQ